MTFREEMFDIIQKNQTLEVEITNVTSSGDGIAKVESYPLFIKGGVTGDLLSVTVTKTNKTYGFARIDKILTASPNRIIPECTASKNCGGCDFMHISYEHQKEIKSNTVKNNLQRLGNAKDFEYEEIISADKTYNYRNKAQFPIGKHNEQIVCGFFSKRTHDIVPCDSCLIQSEKINKAVQLFLKYANENKVSVYDEKNHKGILRHIYVRLGNKTDEMLVVIVTNSLKPLPNEDALVKALTKHKAVKGIIQNINTEKTNLVLGDKNRTIWGQNWIYSKIKDLKFKISPQSFFQVNGEQTEKLYEKALEYADITKDDTVFDLYCGVGSISLFLARSAKKVIGVEIVEKAIENAKENAKINNIANANFYAGDCGKVVDALIKKGETADVVVVDPPRKGCSEDLLSLINKISPNRLVYVSCNSATLARDIKILAEYGYTLKKACAVDLFPMSGHCEAVALLQKLEK